MKSLILILSGVAVGLLLAPEKGSETRKKVQGWIDDYRGDAKDMARGAAREAKSEYHDLKNDVKDMAAGV